MSVRKCLFLFGVSCSLLTAMAVVSSKGVLVAAPNAKFPYQAAVTSDKTEIHSGPGSRFYATGKLNKDAKVTVYRHDPGGWYMISPPKGSFSLVRSNYVKKETAQLGIVTQNHVVVRVASSLNKHREVEQRRLMKGDRVRILGEDKVDDRGRILTMYRIAPPRGEFRWVKGDSLIPLDATQRRSHDLNPFAIPSNAVEIEKPTEKNNTPDLRFPIAGSSKKKLASRDENSKEKKRGVLPLGKNTGAVENGATQKEIDRDRQILSSLDKNFRNMTQKDVPEWNIADLTHDYKKLQKATPVTAIASQIDLRLQAMERYRKMKSEYNDLIKLTSATDQKDAELASLQKETEVQFATQDLSFSESPMFDEVSDPFGFPAEATQEFLPDLGPAPNGFPEMTEAIAPPIETKVTQTETPNTQWPSYADQANSPSPNPNLLPSQQFPFQQHQVPQGWFSGAGIVQRIDTQNQTGVNQSLPQFALVSPAGKFLTYLQPNPGVDLNRFVGQSVGVYGARQTHPRWQRDVIAVTKLKPVRLTPQLTPQR